MSKVERKSFNCDCKSSKKNRNNHNNSLFFLQVSIKITIFAEKF